ncbi:6-phosphogluconate dehydrogenase [Afipia sp. P52-10]|uniref:NAD(P)-dependent oxidoreductase n=1 Tax=Afipia sp. P52-10 TaxID=1429916 RepID=UPI0003DF2BC9|nr:NAD(P)-dependent oxidoreductase [Afipia sp. P52-10]ETR75336.1 6-phosphogluconate dehydrogenase [Afipia sp. P52-10]
MTVIAVVAMGEMGAGVARRLVERGATVLTSLVGRSGASAERAKAAGVGAVDDAALVGEADMILSIVPPAAAGATAERFLPLIEKAARKPVFIDCNAIAPQTLEAIAKLFAAKTLPFIDASIIGAAPKADGSSPRLYMSGPIATEADTLKRLGLDVRVLSASLGDASALKMSYAGITKGFQALGASMVLGAGRNGAAESFVAELKASQPQLHAWLVKQLPAMYDKAYRWDGEMREIAKFLLPEQGASEMLTGAANLYEHIAADNRAGPQSEIISTLNRFVTGK